MKFNNIFFDFNGTLLDDLQLTYDIEEEMLVKYGLEPVSMDFYLENFGFPVKDYYRLIGYDFEKVSYDILADEFMTAYMNREEKETFLFEKTRQTLIKFKNLGYKLYVLSASEINLLKKQLTRLGILDLFDGVVADDNFHARGKVQYGNEYIDKNNIDRSKTIMIGDTEHDYEVCEKLGLFPVMFSGGHNSKTKLLKLTPNVVSNYDELYELIRKL